MQAAGCDTQGKQAHLAFHVVCRDQLFAFRLLRRGKMPGFLIDICAIRRVACVFLRLGGCACDLRVCESEFKEPNWLLLLTV